MVEMVRVRYSGMSAKLVSERTCHGMQSMFENADGTVDLTLKTVIAPELKRFVLGNGSEADVLKPREFRDQLLEEAEKMVEVFSQRPTLNVERPMPKG
jgi:predicted DNA-binding transcriptional regulator YafY